jgi:hypothetical protein
MKGEFARRVDLFLRFFMESIMPTVTGLLAISPNARSVDWVKQALQIAVQIEFATLPPYLCAMWSIKSKSDRAHASLYEIVMEEMQHLGLVCNMLNALGEAPKIWPDAVPSYPCAMPGGIRPGLSISLGGLSIERIKFIFMEIEKPHHDVVDPTDPDALTPTVGEFYEAIRAAIATLSDADFGGPNQIVKTLKTFKWMFAINTKQLALDAINLIKEQGEGSTASPRDTSAGGSADPNDLAHFYRFQELKAGKEIDPLTGTFRSPEVLIPFPATYPVAEVPIGGWQGPNIPAAALALFDQTYMTMAQELHQAWATGLLEHLSNSVDAMRDLTDLAVAIMKTEITPGGATYCPAFRV